MKINFEGFYASLDIMWKGMAGLFIVAILIMLIVMALKLFMRKKSPTAENSIE
jgi:regulatory protein YycI of two-component signal transduction system YycFG